MADISVFYGEFCRADSVLREVFERTGCRLITDANILDDAARVSGIERRRLENAFSATTSVFNKFTHEKECARAFLRLAVAEEDRLGERQVRFGEVGCYFHRFGKQPDALLGFRGRLLGRGTARVLQKEERKIVA